ncbi:hypothetical protein BDN72DRAFT_485040 [Pluteus cervinus]|uniref:Uncharacterized protein n=1 Tax=Pluteus cervinus TaxID=181527 RepID=A0ACD3A5Y0_9AGAR|nr:hypothetical protein BDN72DRAFT_485040 [Pluteus cervinus]
MIAGMDDLPKELLDEILPYLTVDELFVIAQLSRRLNILALQLFFPYHSIQSPSTLFKARIQCGVASHLILPTPEELASRRNGALSGLAIAIGIKQIDEFRCRFFLCATCPLASKFRNYRRLIHVLKRLEKVRNISIVFDYPNRFGVGFVPVSVEKQRREIVTELLNLCVEKGCEKLSIQNGCFYPPSLNPAVPPSLNLAVPPSLNPAVPPLKATFSLNMGSLFGSFRGLLPSGHSPKSQGRAFALPLFESARLQTQLTQLEVSSLMMLTPPCWRWTHSILETPSLTSLSLFQIQLPSEVWQTIFGWLIIPIQSKLLDLSVVKCTGLPTQEFISFLLDLKALTYIKLVTPLPPLHRFRLPWTTKTILPALMGITAPPEWIVLLCPSSIPRPTLRYVNIAPGSLFGFSSRIEELNPILKNPVFRDRTGASSVKSNDFESCLIKNPVLPIIELHI